MDGGEEKGGRHVCDGRDKKEKWKRQSFCLTSSGAREDMVGEQKAKPRVKTN